MCNTAQHEQRLKAARGRLWTGLTAWRPTHGAHCRKWSCFQKSNNWELFHLMTWNRFADTTGRQDGNVEVDRVLEHHNRVFQGNVHSIRGKLTQKNDDRISHSAQEINKILQASAHQWGDGTQIKRLKQAQSLEPWCSNPCLWTAQRWHIWILARESPSPLSGFPNSVFSTLNVAEFNDWIKSSVKKLYRQQQFESR